MPITTTYKDILMHGIKELDPECISKETIDITKKFFEQRFDNELKHYNNNKEKATDEFITRKNLELFRYYIEETFLLYNELYNNDNLEVMNTLYKIRRELRDIHNYLCHVIKGKDYC